MPTPIFDTSGKVVGWLDGEVVRSIDGTHVAFVNNADVFDYYSQHLGRFGDGFFRDRQGNAVAFVEGATGPPIVPQTEIPPPAPVFAIAPLGSMPPFPPFAPFETNYWSALTWAEFLGEA